MNMHTLPGQISPPDRALVREELRRLLPGMGELRTALPFGLTALDSCLPDGGLPCGALHEIVPAREASIPAALGFLTALLAHVTEPKPARANDDQMIPPPLRGRSPIADAVCDQREGGAARQRKITPLPNPGEHAIGQRQAARPLFFILPRYGLRRHGRLHGHGLRALGLDPARFVLVETAHRRDALWAMEEALRSGAPAAIAGAIDKLDLKSSQRLHLAATENRLPLFLLRPASPAAHGEGWASAAATRWRVGQAKAALDRFGLLARPCWRLRLERCRNGRPGDWLVEWDHVAYRFCLAASLADPAVSRGAAERAG